MEFRLLYRGSLHAAGGVAEKQATRRTFHTQLSELWTQQPLADATDLLKPPPAGVSLGVPLGPFQFVPLVSSRVHLVCHLDILFLRPGAPGALVVPGGDIDNRLKTLFDALRMPANLGELPKGDQPQPDETPHFYCLLADDSLITRFSVTSDRLLERAAPPSFVTLVVRVVTRVTRAIWANIGLGSD